MTARVRAVTAAFTASGSMSADDGSQSTSTGRAPQRRTGNTDATNVLAGTITSSPDPIRRASSAKTMAAVPDATPMQNRVPQARAHSLLEGLNLATEDVGARVDDFRDCAIDLVSDRSVLSGEVYERNSHVTFGATRRDD